MSIHTWFMPSDPWQRGRCLLSWYWSSSWHVLTNFPKTNLRILSTQILCNNCFDLLNCSKLRKQSQGICLFFQQTNVGEKICRFVFGKFVKTCHELDNSRYEILPKGVPNDWRLQIFHHVWCQWRSYWPYEMLTLQNLWPSGSLRWLYNWYL